MHKINKVMRGDVLFGSFISESEMSHIKGFYSKAKVCFQIFFESEQ